MTARSLSLQVNGNGSIEPTAGTYEYYEGDMVNIIAVPDDGWQFDRWNGNVADPLSTSTTISMTSDETVTATFSQIETVWSKVIRIIYGPIIDALTSLANLFEGT
jgi:hypothetical protein